MGLNVEEYAGESIRRSPNGLRRKIERPPGPYNSALAFATPAEVRRHPRTCKARANPDELRARPEGAS